MGNEGEGMGCDEERGLMVVADGLLRKGGSCVMTSEACFAYGSI